MKGEIDTLLARLGHLAGELPPDQVPDLLGHLEAVRAHAWARLAGLAANGRPEPQVGNDGDRLLTVKEAASLLGVSPRWLYRRSGKLPFARRLSRKCLRFSKTGLQKWRARKTA